MATKKRKFKTEMTQLLDIIIHSLYSHKEIFLRELISNAGDAIDKMRFQALDNKKILEGNDDWAIEITPNKEDRTLTISDNGIGMSEDEIATNLGTIAHSDSHKYLEKLKSAKSKDKPELIGQFGVGFYASFMVAESVTVISRPANGKGVKWRSKGDGQYTLDEVEKEQRGTDVILHLKEDEAEFLEPHTIKHLVTKFSNFLEHPIKFDDEVINSQKAIWLRSKSDVEEEEYNEFYKTLTHDFEDPMETIHYLAEGTMNFRALLYLPSKKPFDIMQGQPKSKLHLYIKRVFISDDCNELLPSYLRFVKGVVDASDVPLNVSREMLQHNPMLRKIQKNLVSKVLKTLKAMKEREFEKYRQFYSEFGAILKEGLAQDMANKDKIAELLLFESNITAAGEVTTLDDYIKDMSDEQNKIYFLSGEDRSSLEKSPHLETFAAKNWEVLFLTDPVDEFVIPSLNYKDKSFAAANKDEIEESEEEKEAKESKREEFKGFLNLLNDTIQEVKEVRLSTRLKKSAACLVMDKDSMSKQMQAMMKQMGQDVPDSKRILEINPDHPAVKALRNLSADENIKDYLPLLYDQARIAEGVQIDNPAEFATRINKLLEKAAQ